MREQERPTVPDPRFEAWLARVAPGPSPLVLLVSQRTGVVSVLPRGSTASRTR